MRYAIIFAFICRPLPVNLVPQDVILQANDFFLNLGGKETIPSFLPSIPYCPLIFTGRASCRPGRFML